MDSCINNGMCLLYDAMMLYVDPKLKAQQLLLTISEVQESQLTASCTLVLLKDLHEHFLQIISQPVKIEHVLYFYFQEYTACGPVFKPYFM